MTTKLRIGRPNIGLHQLGGPGFIWGFAAGAIFFLGLSMFVRIQGAAWWRLLGETCDVVQLWMLSAWGYFTGPDGYKVLIALAGAYIGLHKLRESIYLRVDAQARAERENLLSMEASDNVHGFSSATRIFGPVQMMRVPPAPEFLKHLSLFRKYSFPNKEFLWAWVRDRLDSRRPPTGCTGDDLRFDLRQANFQGADLHEVNLSKVDLRNVNLEGADLRKANLEGANLVGVNLRSARLGEANLREANLGSARLWKADLSNANLSAAILRSAELDGADLSHADLRWANLRRASLSGATLWNTRLHLADISGINLSGAKKLDTVRWNSNEEGLVQVIDTHPIRTPGIRYRIGVSYQSLQFPFVTALQTAIRKSAREYDVELIEVDADNDVQRELENIRAILGDIDCLAIEAVKLDASAAAIEAANQAGVPVIQFNVRANGGEWVSFVGSEQAESGDLLAEWLIGYYEESGKNEIKGIYLRGLEGQVTDVTRAYALNARLKSSGRKDRIKFVREIFADYEREKAQARIKSVLARGLEFDFIIANNDSMILGALDAMRECNWTREVATAGIDGLPEALEQIRRGGLQATIFQNPQLQGAGAIKACVDYLSGKELSREVLIPFRMVTIRNLDEIGEVAPGAYASR